MTSVHMDLESYNWDNKPEVHGSFQIRDCSNYISLDIYVDNERHYKTQVKALDKLADALSEFKQELTDRWEEEKQRVHSKED